MRALIERGYLYIAQPPLFKVQEGKRETFLKDEKEHARFLLARLGEDRTLVAEGGRGASVAGTQLSRRITELQDYLALTRRLEGRGLREPFVRALAAEGLAGDAFRERARLEDLVARLSGLVTRLELVGDDEHGGFALAVAQETNGVVRTNRLDAAFFASFDMKRAQDLTKALDGFLDGPYRLERGTAETKTATTLSDAVNLVLESGKKGLAISRYKGLGEMNPETLWATTMNPGTRRLLQVRIEDAVEADEIFTILMGDAVEPRRQFIEANALNVANLDI
ncbi:MAG: hypothetical protein JNK60_19580 [Acidobacteria bacterium]|nr:hypothetical protein [Acidobacteriota bacterium]